MGRDLAAWSRRRLRPDEVPRWHGVARSALGARSLAEPRPGRGAHRPNRPARARTRTRQALSLHLSRRAVEYAVLRAPRFLAGASRRVAGRLPPAVHDGEQPGPSAVAAHHHA